MWKRSGAIFICLLWAGGKSLPRELHFSFWSDNPKPYLEAIRKSPEPANLPLTLGERVRGGIVTHHFLASGLMVRFFAELKEHASPKTIILLGPNHYHHGLANISMSSLPWKTPFGILPADPQLAHRVSKAVELPEDPEAFTGEHSVGVLIPFVKYYFPQSRVVPVLIDVNAKNTQLRRLRGVISAALDNPDTLLLLSMDFSHDSVATIAEARDQEAQSIIAAMDSSGTDGLHVDSRKGLWLFLESLKRAGCGVVKFGEHTNSAWLTGKPEQRDVTSYFTIYFLANASGTIKANSERAPR